MSKIFYNVADLKDSSDPQGRTYREINHAKMHGIPIDALVEVSNLDEPEKSGIRLFVKLQSRDCDGTPLYWLGPELDDVQENPSFANRKWIGGYDEDCLTVIRLPAIAEQLL
jgi:hypothetical protein